jgi:NAD+ synthase (glutamine-hydrolysing)
MKIALAQQNYHIGNFKSTIFKIKEAISKAKAAGANLIVFPELAVCGYPPKDFLLYTGFIDSCDTAIKEISEACIGIAAIVGAPYRNKKSGKPLFNTACFLADGALRSTHHKALLPTYDIFDEARYFESGNTFECIDYMGFRIALTICEDLWDDACFLYSNCPMSVLIKENPDLMINIAASPFSYAQEGKRKEILQKNVAKYKCPMVYVNHVGAQTDLIFDGGSLAMNDKGEVIHSLPYFEEDLRFIDLPLSVSALPITEPSMTINEKLYKALIVGIRDYFGKTGLKQAVLGLSGGIDSALVLVLAVEALGKENVKAILMPSQHSSDHSIEDAKKLANTLNVAYEIIPIQPIYNTLEASLQPHFKDLPPNLTEENLQARTRGILLMAISNKLGYVVINTTNKSELAVGYGTMYGDLIGAFSVLGDVYKTQIFDLARYINKDKEIIPENTLTKAPSAELRPDQKDSDSLPEYKILDAILFQYIENVKDAKDIIASGFDAELVERVVSMVNKSEYKRHQSPPILRVSGKAFGSGRRMPIVGKYEQD